MRTTYGMMGLVVTIWAAVAAGAWPRAADVGPRRADDVGCGEFTTRKPMVGEVIIEQLPFIIAEPGRYILTKDLTAEASGIAIAASDVTLDLNGHTITYGLGVAKTDPAGRGVMTYNSRQKGNVGHAGIRLPARPDVTEDWPKGVFGWNPRRTGIVVRNGRVTHGTGEGLAYSPAVDLGGAQGVEVSNLRIDMSAPDSEGLIVGKGGTAQHCTLRHSGTHVTNRHQMLAVIVAGAEAEIARCRIDGGPQIGVKATAGSRVHDNIIEHRATVTNCYGVAGYGQPDVQVFHNRIAPANGRGIHLSEKSRRWRVHHNYVEVRETPNKEYSRMQTHGIKLEGTRDSEVYRNVVVSVSVPGGEPTPLNLDIHAGSNNAIYENVFYGVKASPDEKAYGVYLVGRDGDGSTIRDNLFYTDGIGVDVNWNGARRMTFTRCRFGRVGAEAPSPFIHFWNVKPSAGHRFVDCTFTDGIDPTTFAITADPPARRAEAGYAIEYSLALSFRRDGQPLGQATATILDTDGKAVFSGRTDRKGALAATLVHFAMRFAGKTAEPVTVRPGPYRLRIVAGDAVHELTLPAVAPMATTVDHSEGGPVILTAPTLPPAEAGRAYELPLQASGADVTWRLAGGTLPEGIQLDAGAVKGTPTRAGAYSLTVEATGGGRPTSKKLLLSVVPPRQHPWRIAPATQPAPASGESPRDGSGIQAAAIQGIAGPSATVGLSNRVFRTRQRKSKPRSSTTADGPYRGRTPTRPAHGRTSCTWHETMNCDSPVGPVWCPRGRPDGLMTECPRRGH